MLFSRWSSRGWATARVHLPRTASTPTAAKCFLTPWKHIFFRLKAASFALMAMFSTATCYRLLTLFIATSGGALTEWRNGTRPRWRLTSGAPARAHGRSSPRPRCCGSMTVCITSLPSCWGASSSSLVLMAGNREKGKRHHLLYPEFTASRRMRRLHCQYFTWCL